MSAPAWLGIDLGGTKMLAVVYGADGQVLGSAKRKTKAQLGQAAGLERLLKTAEEAVAAAGLAGDALRGVGIGCPGPLDLEAGVLLSAANLGWERVDLRALLQEKFGVPVAVANDVDAGVFGEALAGAGRGKDRVLGVFPGTGIGGGMVDGGRLFQGRRSSCMEIGHLRVLPEGPRCGCGRRGCLEAVASRLAVATGAAAAAMRGQAPWLKEHAGTDPEKYRSGTLAEAIAHGDTRVRELVEDACDHLGGALGDLVNVLAPDAVVLGGGMVEAMAELMLPRIAAAMQPRVMEAYAGSYTLVAASLGDQAVSLGAAALARSLVDEGRPGHG